MVVLSAMAAVEVRMPNQEVEVIVNQLRTDCTLLLSDREGQEALGRILRHPKGMVLMRAIKGLSQKHIGGEFTSHKSVAATLPQLLIPTQENPYNSSIYPLNRLFWHQPPRAYCAFAPPVLF